MPWYLHFRPSFLPTLDGPDPAGLLQGAENLDLCPGLGLGLGVCDSLSLGCVGGHFICSVAMCFCLYYLIYLLYYTLPRVMRVRWAAV